MELLIPLKNNIGTPMYEQIYLYMKEEIRQGSLGAGLKLPSTRVLAENLKVSRSTTQMAYDQLLSEGYIEAVPCRGYFVSRLEGLVEVSQEVLGDLIPVQKKEKTAYKVDFSPRGIDLDSFPYNTWRKISRDTLVDDNREMFLSGDPQGELPLRQSIGRYLHSARGVNCQPEQIVVGAGSEYLLLLLSQILGTDHMIAMENPTYKQAYRVFHSLGYPVASVNMDKYGMSTSRLSETDADIAYVMPSHQYPMGIVMPVKRRQELLAWAGQREGRFLIEDDYDSEFRYKGKPIPALQGMDQREKVIYIGTFSKSIAPAIRVSYMVLPRPLLNIYREKISFYASTVSRIDQNILYQFLCQGHYERHLNRMRGIYKAKHDALIGAVKNLEKVFHIQGEHAGLHILMTPRKGRLEEWTEEQLIQEAQKQGVGVYGLSSFYIHPQHNENPTTIILGYANLSEKEILEGVHLLELAWMN